ncbi:MAG: CotH kinase family protein, partial [Myxococcota bacterium]
ADLHDDWINGAWREEMEIEHNPYYPLDRFAWNDIEITDAAIRLRGNPEYWPEQNKMQWQVSFNKYNKSGRFLGLRKMLFDAAAPNRSFLRDRLGLKLMRDAGVPAPCANSARLEVNGSYYGLFTSIEKIDDEFLARVFAADDGDLWKRSNWELKTNENSSDSTRLDALNDAESTAELGAYLDIAQAIRVWTMDALLGNADGPWAGGLNFYLYDEPQRGKFILLPWDLDQTFTRLPYNVDPYAWHKQERFRGRPYYELSLARSTWFATYLDTIEELVDTVWDVDRLLALTDDWAAQIYADVAADPNKPFETTRHLERLDELRAVIQLRPLFVREWLACWRSGGVDDGTGHCVIPE